MPNKDLTVTANYGEMIVAYKLNINNGKGNGSFEKGKKITITADDSSSVKKHFIYWGGAKGFIDDSTRSTATITMPNKDLTVSANYETVVGIASVTNAQRIVYN